MATATSREDPIRLISELPTAKERFLARIVDQVLQDQWRTPDDFLRHFPPATIVESLASADALRVKLLIAATGMHERIALKKSISSASEDLALALEEGTTDAATLLDLYPPDDKVRYFDAQQLWDFITEDEFWNAQPSQDKPAHTRAAARMTFMLECALDEQLITLKDLADGMTFQQIASSLPVMELQEVVKHALQIARADAPLTEERLLAVVPLHSLVEYVPLDHTWQEVILEKVAAPCGWAEASAAEQPDAALVSDTDLVPPSAPSRPEPLKVPSEPAAAKSDRPPEEDEARRKVKERLAKLERLPPRAEDLSTPILLSIESMYADLLPLTDDSEREACIREAFPNEAFLRVAMLALIELLDPSIDTNDPVIRDADIEGLIKIVLFEERRRGEPRKTPSSSPGSPRRTKRSMPPPLPRSAGSSPPPLPDDGPRSKRAT